MQNLKLDIIYHQTPSDFELEFNLCGCCRMRLLSDKTTDKKGFIKALARDVARSRVIIGCGPLFGDDGLISLVTRAIGSTLTLCDNKIFGITSNEEIYIINGSTPLVTPDGYFGGCIIESGPQTIILLTENRAFRKAIMQNLIHPYIEEISYSSTRPTTPAPKTETTEFEPAVNEQEVYLTQDDYADSAIEESPTLEVPQGDHNIEFIMDNEDPDKDIAQTETDAVTQNNDYSLMYTEIESEKEIKARYQDPYVPSESDNMFLSSFELDDEDTSSKKQKTKSHKIDITLVLLIMFLLLAVLALVYLIVLKPLTMGISTGDYIKEIFGIASQNTLI